MKVFSIILTIFFSSSIYCQTSFHYGFKIGLSSATQSFDFASISNEDEYDYRYGFYIDTFTELLKSEHLSLVAGLSYNQKGMVDEQVLPMVWGNEDGFISEKKVFNNRLDYLTISTNLKTRYELSYITTYLLTGIKYDFLIGKKINPSSNEVLIKYDFYNRLYKRFNGNIFGLTLGVGVENESLFGLPILLEWVYNHDLNKTRVSEALEITNLSNEVKLGIKF